MSDIIEITDFGRSETGRICKNKRNPAFKPCNQKTGFYRRKSESSGAGTGCGVRADFYSGGKETRRRRSKTDHKRCGQIPVYTAEFDVLTKITGFKLTRGMSLCDASPKLRP